MLRLLIDSMPVNLSADINFDYNSANPFFTKSGEYTLDIDINLNDPANALVYKSIDRLDIITHPKKRKAVLYDEKGIIINGTEIILEIDIHNAKIQLVAGNSDLNYLANDETSIRDLNLGSIQLTSLQTELAGLNSFYPQRNYVCTPVMRKIDDSNTDLKNTLITSANGPVFDPSVTLADLHPQPFLLYYVEKMVEVLGYKIKTNCLLQEEKWCRLILVNGIDTLEYAKMLPNWKSSEFFTEIEKLFNVIFVVDQVKKTVDIISVVTFYNEKEIINISADNVLDQTNKKFDQDESLYINYKNVKYDFPDYDYYKYADIEPGILKMCTKTLIDNWTVDTQVLKDNYNKMIFYYLQPVKTYMMQSTLSVSDPDGNIITPAGYNQLMSFQRVVNDSSSTDFVELKIVPSEIRGVILERGESYFGVASMPITRNSFELSTNATMGLNEYVKQGIPEEPSPDKIFIAFYDGIIGFTSAFTEHPDGSVTYNRLNATFPECHTREAEMCNPFTPYANCLFPQNITLQLDGDNGMYKKYYDGNIVVDTTTEYIIKFRNLKRPSPMSIFVIANKKFYCKNLKYTITSGRMSEITEGTFYLITD